MTGPFVSRRPLLLVLALAVLGAACTEELSTSSACGGLCPDCADGAMCLVAADCMSGNCASLICAP